MKMAKITLLLGLQSIYFSLIIFKFYLFYIKVVIKRNEKFYELYKVYLLNGNYKWLRIISKMLTHFWLKSRPHLILS